ASRGGPSDLRDPVPTRRAHACRAPGTRCGRVAAADAEL
ncbi:MAG: hypothetical protein AVDCRST_MAG19-1008, partial [uncultured Thermomicrobiales bacterium]